MFSAPSCVAYCTALITTLVSLTSMAEEKAIGHYLPGSVTTIADMTPTQPGWVIEPLLLNYQGAFNNNSYLSFNKQPTKQAYNAQIGIDSDVDLTIDAAALVVIHTFDTSVLGADWSSGIVLPYVKTNIDIDITTQSTIDLDFNRPLNQFDGRYQRGSHISIHDSDEGLGDVILIPAMLAWQSGYWTSTAQLFIYTPTGSFDSDKLVNVGLNYWTLNPMLGLSYSNPNNGFNSSVYAGVTLNSENTDTDYKSGSVVHIDASVQQLLPLGDGFIGIGAMFYLYDQFTDDSGSGASLGSFKSYSAGMGPVLSYIIPLVPASRHQKAETLVFELRWLQEQNTENKFNGDYLWAKAVWQF